MHICSNIPLITDHSYSVVLNCKKAGDNKGAEREIVYVISVLENLV